MGTLDLKIDGSFFTSLEQDLALVIDEFAKASENASSVADDVGHSTLADRIHSFESSWGDKRTEMTEMLTAMQSNVKTMAEGFSQTDQALKDGLTAPGSTVKKESAWQA